MECCFLVTVVAKNWPSPRCWHVFEQPSFPFEAFTSFSSLCHIGFSRRRPQIPKTSTTPEVTHILRFPISPWKTPDHRDLRWQLRHVPSPHWWRVRPCIQGGHLWITKRFPACNPNSPAPTITSVTTNRLVKIVQLRRSRQHSIRPC